MNLLQKLILIIGKKKVYVMTDASIKDGKTGIAVVFLEKNTSTLICCFKVGMENYHSSTFAESFGVKLGYLLYFIIKQPAAKIMTDHNNSAAEAQIFMAGTIEHVLRNFNTAAHDYVGYARNGTPTIYTPIAYERIDFSKDMAAIVATRGARQVALSTGRPT